MIDEKRLAEIEARVTVWAKEVNPQRRIDALDLIAEVRRLTGETELENPLDWKPSPHGDEVILGDFGDENGVRMSLLFMPTCYRRGPWRLLIEIEDRLRVWGCFDSQDQPVRYYHSLERAKAEAQAIADVLLKDHAVKANEKGT